MDYFQELLQSYQKIKKRTFRVGYIVEQQQDPMAEYNKAAQAAQALVSQGVVPIDRGQKLGAAGQITAYTSKVKGQIFPGLALTSQSGQIPGSQNYAVRLSTIEGNAEAQKKIGEILLGKQPGAEGAEPLSGDQEAQAAQDGQQPIQPIITPEQMMDMEYQSSLARAVDGVKSLITGKFFQSIYDKATGQYPIDARTGLKKQYDWIRDDRSLEELFLSRNSGSLKRKLDEGIMDDGLPPSAEKKLEFTRTFEKFLDIAGKVKEGSASLEDIEWVKKHIQTGKHYTDKRTMRIKSGESDTAINFRWVKGEGSRADTQLWKHLIDSYDESVDQWAKNQVPVQNPEDLKLERVALREVAEGTGMLNAIRGFFAEDFQPLSNLLKKAVDTATSDPAKSQMYKEEATKIFIASWEKNGEALLKAFNAYEAYMGEGVAVDDDVLSELNEFKELANVFNVSINEAKIKNMDDVQKKQLANVLTMKVARSLIMLDSQFALKLDADYIATVGKSTANGKKTDNAYVFSSREKAIVGLKRAGIPDSMIDQFILDGVEATQIFGPEIGQFVERSAKAGAAPVVVPVGIKTYTKAKGITLGTSSAKETFKTLTDGPTRQAQLIRERLQTRFGSTSYKQHSKNIEQLSTMSTELDGLKWNGRSKTIPKETLKKIKSILGKESVEWKDISTRIEEYEKNPESDPELRYELNAYIENEKKDFIVKSIKSGLKKGDKSWLCTLSGLLKSTGSAEEQNQITLARYMKENESHSINHNAAIDELINGLDNNSLTLDYTANGFSVRTNCKGKRVCDDDHYGSLNLSEGTFELEYTLNSVRRHGASMKPAVGVGINASTELIVNFLLGQKQLLEQLLTKYQ